MTAVVNWNHCQKPGKVSVLTMYIYHRCRVQLW